MSKQSKVIQLAKVEASCSSCSLKELCLPHGLDRNELEQLDEIVKRRKPLSRGQYLFRAGQVGKSIYAVRSGSIKTYVTSNDGLDQVLGFHLAGELLGLDAFGSDMHSCYAVALERSSVCELPRDQIEDLCKSIPGLRQQLQRIIGKEIDSDHQMLLLLGKRTAEERLATFLLSLSRRMSLRGFSKNEFNLTMPRKDIANYLGLAEETISRLFSRFEDQSIIHVDRKSVHINNFDSLNSMIGEDTSQPSTAS